MESRVPRSGPVEPSARIIYTYSVRVVGQPCCSLFKNVWCMYMLPDEYEQVRLRVAAGVRALERALSELTTALSHRETWICGQAATERANRQAICDAYATIDLGMEDAPNQSVVVLGAAAVDRTVLKLAEQVNQLKAELRTECAPLQRIRRRVPRKEGGTEAIPVVRAILRSIQRSELNLLAAYRKIPILGAQPISIAYTRARTRAVYRKTVAQIGDLLQQSDAPAAVRDRARLEGLRASETHLALVRDHYENIRANIVYDGLDRRGRGRIMISAELPILFLQKTGAAPPRIQFPEDVADGGKPARKPRRSLIEPEPWLESLPVHRYNAPTTRTRT